MNFYAVCRRLILTGSILCFVLEEWESGQVDIEAGLMFGVVDTAGHPSRNVNQKRNFTRLDVNGCLSRVCRQTKVDGAGSRLEPEISEMGSGEVEVNLTRTLSYLERQRDARVQSQIPIQ